MWSLRSFHACHPHLATCFFTRGCSGLCVSGRDPGALGATWPVLTRMFTKLLPGARHPGATLPVLTSRKALTALRHAVRPPAAASCHRHPSGPSSTAPNPPPVPPPVASGTRGCTEHGPQHPHRSQPGRDTHHPQLSAPPVAVVMFVISVTFVDLVEPPRRLSPQTDPLSLHPNPRTHRARCSPARASCSCSSC